MEYIYAPWRSNYVKRDKPKDSSSSKKECPFCKQFKETKDQENYILKRGKYNNIILNLYPYNAGHIMIIPNKHYSRLSDFDISTRTELIELTSQACDILKNKFNCEGINAGLNLGRAAGAGIPEHLHLHILPRWIGDTNFTPLLANTKTISFDLNLVYNDLEPEFKKIKA